jgi:hypothetical protein
LHASFKIPYLLTRFYYKTMQAAGRSHTKSWKCKFSQHWTKRSSNLVAVRHTTIEVSVVISIGCI